MRTLFLFFLTLARDLRTGGSDAKKRLTLFPPDFMDADSGR
jgi:hypothetical protein